MTPPAPRSPYPRRGGRMMSLRSPTAMEEKDSSHPRMTCPAPTLKVKGLFRSRELSNFFSESKSSNHPV
eukprot:CAMPEP_0198299092 /NCGR_PEP_ID=MMETSP1449-20131203/43370_1 /TAXON_ID=420275 /ORGANISM="Attheya septentrionalis, Strain CCMP2084" /LENGTH=68 /DNA_ID=CAMNT_0044000535 /DNA_START=330 /DNA_END=536 /DNA_ORIENTATION=+